jgi:Tfp pilus assembly protein PilW
MSPDPSDGSSRPRGRGVTLVETLIGAVIFASVSTGIYLLYTTMLNTMTRGELQTELQQSARVALAQMTQEIRMAGYDPPGGSPPTPVIPQVGVAPKAAIRAATPGCFSFVGDALGQGTADQFTYDLNGTTLRRRIDSWLGSPSYGFSAGVPQPLAESLDTLTFTYFDADNNVLTPASWTSTHRCPPVAGASAQAIVQLTFTQMRQVRRVAISLKTKGSRPRVFPVSYTLTSDVRLRNQ